MSFPDQETLRRVIQGDEIAFSQLYTHFRNPALNFCNNLLKDEEEAENVIQDVFAKIWDRRSQIKPEYSFQSYLFVSLRNQVFDQFKKIEKDRLLREEYMERMKACADEEMDEKERTIEHLKDEINKLSEKRKRIFKLNVEEGKSYKEISDYLNISINTVKNQLIKAKQILRRQASGANPYGSFANF
jgi:RNA polymerase sigma-70 factor (family 1)